MANAKLRELESIVKNLKQDGYLPALEALEQELLNDLVNRMISSTDYKEHLELVKLRGMIDGIKLLQLRRKEMAENFSD